MSKERRWNPEGKPRFTIPFFGLSVSASAVLSTLRIKNLALVSDLTLELSSGFVAITGETGAGKSVILGALNLVLGRRADRGMIRSGEEACLVEAVLDVTGVRAPIAAFLDEHGLEPCDGGQLVLKRAFTAAGTNRQFVNGSPTTLATLAALGGWLVDLHGPHDHQSLLQVSRQLSILDAYGGLESKREIYRNQVRLHSTLAASLTELGSDDRTYAQQVDLLRHQVREIEVAQLKANEENEVIAEHRLASNAVRLLDLSTVALEALGDGDGAALTVLSAVGRALIELTRLDESMRPLLLAHEQSVSLLQDLRTDLSRQTDRIDLDPARLMALEERLNLIQTLKRKYGGSVEAILDFARQASERLEQLEGRDVEVARLGAALESAKVEIRFAGLHLTKARQALLSGLNAAVSQELETLGFRQGRFSAELISTEPESDFAADGFDRVEFQFAPNPGEPPRPLRSIGSSGELARVMLALKTVLADQDEVPVLVFDEVDANVGGETAWAVGGNMARISRKHQVLCITHLAQVAAQASSHQVVSKELITGRTESRIESVTGEVRIAELARMLGGGAAARAHAIALVEEAEGAG